MNCGNTAHGEAKLLHEVPQQLVGRVLGALARILEAPLPKYHGTFGVLKAWGFASQCGSAASFHASLYQGGRTARVEVLKLTTVGTAPA